ncbi:MAG TPA: hypothetical protein VN493_31350 [Thermoanaerobaculia bacterium]|nr:hypothetical protein [Thermoanaerobaculia bacterium]
MAVPDLRPAGTLLPSKTLCAGLLLVVLAGCAVPPPPKAEEPQAPAPTQVIDPAPAPTPAPKPMEPPQDNVVVLDSGGQKAASSTTSLADAARAAREQRAHADPPAHVITNQNLKQYAAKGQITVASPAKKPELEEEGTPQEEPLVRDEQYWRGRALEVRLRWRKAADDVKELEQSAAGWRRRFYAENDIYVRNGQVKPEWDRVLDRLEEARAEAETAKTELAELLEEGRTAGALPGWLREGVDQEPKEEPEPSNEHKAIDPPIVEKKQEEDGR